MDGGLLSYTGNSGLWISDSSGKYKTSSLDIPPGSWAILKLIPVSDDGLGIYCRYPTGSVVMLASGQVV